MTASAGNAVEVIAQRGNCLPARCHFDWPATVQQAVYRLRMGFSDTVLTTGPMPVLAAVVGGASSGKSTLFNNLLGGHVTSRIAAWGHTTLGPVLAVHERHRPLVERLLDVELLLPGLRRMPTELDGDFMGEAGAVAILFHAIEELGGVLLFDLPDFTSEDARTEGDISLSLLPWFDRVVVVLDHERWFDRQSLSDLRALSIRLGQQRFVAFNRTREGEAAADDVVRLKQQAVRMDAEGLGIMEFRRGRGFRVLPPASLEGVRTFLCRSGVQRERALLSFVADAANRTLNQNEERSARLEELRQSLHATLKRTLPSLRDCITGLTTGAERRQLEVASRVLRIGDPRQWLADQTRRIQLALRRVPVVGAVMGRAERPDDESGTEATDRRAIAVSYYQTAASRQAHEVRCVIGSSGFWEEIRSWKGIEPAVRESVWTPGLRAEVERTGEAFDAALRRWIEKVEKECKGLSPYLTGAVGAGALALAVLLIAVPGPVALLSLVAIKGAIGGALAQLAVAAGAGAALGKPVGRLIAVIQEKLIGGPEFHGVQKAAAAFRALIEADGRRLAEDAMSEASTTVIAQDDPLLDALETLRRLSEPSP